MAYIVDYLTENTDIDFEYVKLDTNLITGRPARYFLTDWRDYHAYAYNPHWCVHNATQSPATLLRSMHWAQQHRPTRIAVFEATSKIQVSAWIRHNWGSETNIYKYKHPIPSGATLKTQERIMINSTSREIERLQMVAIQAQERLLYLQSLPKEPTGKNAVIKFTRRFSAGGKKYHYAAIRTKEGWYTTGPRTPKAYSWTDLIVWINEFEPVDVKVMVDQRSISTLSNSLGSGV